MHNGDFKVGFSLVSLLYDISMSERKPPIKYPYKKESL